MKIKRHNLAIRFTHWMPALSIFVLIFTGFGQMPVYKRYFVDQLPGLGWSSNFLITLNIHYAAAMVLIFISAFYLTYLLRSKRFDIIPRRGDFKESVQIFASMVGLTEEPDNDKYLAEQRLAFAVTASSVLALIVTGLVKAYKNLPGVSFSPEAVFWLAQVHNLFTVILLLSIIVHLLAFLIKANRPLVPSIFTGQIDTEYVMHRHRKWWERINARAGLNLEDQAAQKEAEAIAFDEDGMESNAASIG
ncbi:MAG: cytochrome b/b6 domain-containing protein [Syntrophomonadaceae bacterium]|nr:cytochrome b/b6 domain-containing protein [Syntrophomonadaceae bacterium]